MNGRYLLDTNIIIAFFADEIAVKNNLAQANEVIDQPKVSALMRGRLTGFSLERMFRFLNTLGIDVEITVRPKLRDNARITVV